MAADGEGPFRREQGAPAADAADAAAAAAATPSDNLSVLRTTMAALRKLGRRGVAHRGVPCPPRLRARLLPGQQHPARGRDAGGVRHVAAGAFDDGTVAAGALRVDTPSPPPLVQASL